MKLHPTNSSSVFCTLDKIISFLTSAESSVHLTVSSVGLQRSRQNPQPSQPQENLSIQTRQRHMKSAIKLLYYLLMILILNIPTNYLRHTFVCLSQIHVRLKYVSSTFENHPLILTRLNKHYKNIVSSGKCKKINELLIGFSNMYIKRTLITRRLYSHIFCM